MPALLIKRDKHARRYYVVRTENRPAHLLMQDTDNAKNNLLQTGSVWIPAYLRKLLEDRVGKPIKPLLLYDD